MDHECREGIRERLACLEPDCGKTTRELLLEGLLTSLLGACERAMEERCGCWESKCAYHTIKAKADQILKA